MEFEIVMKLDDAAEVPLSIASQTGQPVMADRMKIAWNAVVPDNCSAEWFLDNDLVLAAQLDIGQALGTVFSPVVQVAGPERILRQMLSSHGHLWSDRIRQRPGHTPAQCIGCGDKIYGEVALRGACLSCFPLVNMAAGILGGCEWCGVGPEDECVPDCPSPPDR